MSIEVNGPARRAGSNGTRNPQPPAPLHRPIPGHRPPPPDPRAVGARQVFQTVPKDLAHKLRPLAGLMVRDALREVYKAVPVYAQLTNPHYRATTRAAVEMAIVKCFDNICDPHAKQADWKGLYRHVGELEAREGRNMDSLQTAVRVGARVVWQHVSRNGRAMGIPTETLFVIADAIFAWVDELCSMAILGYTEAKAKASGALERRRRQLVRMLLGDRPVSQQALIDLAGSADWPLPERVAVVALEYRDDPDQLAGLTLGPEVLIDLDGTEPCLVVVDPRTSLAGLAEGLGGRRAAVGPTVPLADAHRSLACARRTLTLVQRRVLPGTQVTWCEEHLSVLALLADEFLIAQLTAKAMEPFEKLTVKQRERLATTLLAWLETRGGINDVATKLNVHPQTVRYRIHQLEELLGDRLTDPDERLAIEIALRARRLLGGTTPGAADGDEEDEPALR